MKDEPTGTQGALGNAHYCSVELHTQVSASISDAVALPLRTCTYNKRHATNRPIRRCLPKEGSGPKCWSSSQWQLQLLVLYLAILSRWILMMQYDLAAKRR
jgi:hypothetical protein